MSFWNRLPRPFVAMAPMEGVSDRVLRALVTHLASPDVLFTEFVGAELLAKNDPQTLERLKFFPGEGQNTVVQLWGSDPQAFRLAVGHPEVQKFPAIDINLGCPAKSILGKGGGAALVGQFSRVKEIVAQVRRGMEESSLKSLSFKTRLAETPEKTRDWWAFLLDLAPDALTVHGRTPAQGYGGRADWEALETLPALRQALGSRTLVVGNGDLDGPGLAARKKITGLDGLMVGRAILGDPFLFLERSPLPGDDSPWEAFRLLVRLFQTCGCPPAAYARLKKFAKGFLASHPRWARARESLLASTSFDQMVEVTCAFGTSSGEVGSPR